jgi:arginyl-tRNA synthetase
LKDHLKELLDAALTALVEDGTLALSQPRPEIAIDPPRHANHGDFSSNIAMLLAKPCRMAPLAIAEALVRKLPRGGLVRSVETAAPGFINFFVDPTALFKVIADILRAPEQWGRAHAAHAGRIQLEFVSANPTGPLHVGHGRGAAYGAALANLLRAAGYDVVTEYYVNDAGRQMDILALSVWLRYLEQLGVAFEFPRNAYRGDYVRDIARALVTRDGARFAPDGCTLPTRAPETDDEEFVDACIEYCRTTLGAGAYAEIHAFGCDAILEEIKQDLARFGVQFDCWYSERSLLQNGLLDQALTRLRATEFMYRKDGAEWFRSTAFGDEKDRVVVRENGAPTYFASDIAYHADKFARGFDRVLNIWGADHHGYIPRVRAALAALGLDPTRLEILLVQFASLYRGGEKVQMSTRSGEFVTLRELIDEVGADAARFFYTTRRCEQHLDFDLDLAKRQSQDNPVYYLQYAHARICSVFRQLAQLGAYFDQEAAISSLSHLGEPKEHALAALLGRYPDVIRNAAERREPHAVANYLHDLATEYHAYYNAHKILVDDLPLRQARLALCAATRAVLASGLTLLGVAAPEEM